MHGDVEKPMGEDEDEEEAEETVVAEPGTEAEQVFELWSELMFVDVFELEEEREE